MMITNFLNSMGSTFAGGSWMTGEVIELVRGTETRESRNPPLNSQSAKPCTSAATRIIPVIRHVLKNL